MRLFIAKAQTTMTSHYFSRNSQNNKHISVFPLSKKSDNKYDYKLRKSSFNKCLHKSFSFFFVHVLQTMWQFSSHTVILQGNVLVLFQLRDNCHCEKCVHPQNKQKLLDTVSLDINIKPVSYHVTDEGKLKIVWPENGGVEHVSHYDSEW